MKHGKKIENMLKPYMTYTQRYVNSNGSIDVYITYSLDNYIAVTGTINGNYENRSGYLLQNYNSVNANILEENNLSETLLIYDPSEPNPEDRYKLKAYNYVYIRGEKVYYTSTQIGGRNWFIYEGGKQIPTILDSSITSAIDTNGKDYVTDAKNFSSWVNSTIGSLKISDLKLEDDVKERNKNSIYGYEGQDIEIFDFSGIESEESAFNIHRIDMIKLTIKESLSNAMAAYNEHTDTQGSFAMPALKETEWDQITGKVCVVSFIQGLPVGFKTYNNYAIVNNNKNNTFIDENSMVFIWQSNATPSVATGKNYHIIDCPELMKEKESGYSLVGYRIKEMEQAAVEVKETDDVGTKKVMKYYYKHDNMPCYYCIVSKIYENQTFSNSDERAIALRTALGRERNIMHNNDYYQ